MRKNTILAVAVSMTAFAAGCKDKGDTGDEGGAQGGVCTSPGYCIDYVGDGWGDDISAEDHCASNTGTWESGSCPSGSVGSCSLEGADGLDTIYYMYDMSAADAEVMCTDTLHGTWSG